MKIYLYKALLSLLRSLIYLKRALFWMGRTLRRLGIKLHHLYTETIGFWLYKGWYTLSKKLAKYKIPFDSRLIELFGKRGTLQVVLFCLALLVMYPSSRLYSQNFDVLPGHQTLLYELIGTQGADYAVEELIIEEVALGDPTVAPPAWKQGAITVDTPGGLGRNLVQGPQDISGISAGGTAISKPTIMGGTDAPIAAASSGQPSQNRTAIVEYTVQSGDVIGKIAEDFGVSVNTILWANNLTFRSYIRPGDTLKILPVPGVLHTVVRGDTVSKIAKTYNTDAAQIIAFNKLQKDGADIVIGEELIIPGGEKPLPRRTLAAQPIVRQIQTQGSTRLGTVAPPPPSIETPAGEGFIWPAGVRYISQYFRFGHPALDIAGKTGTPLYASKAGSVIKSQCGWNGGYGCYIILDHGGGVQTLYGHASELFVSVGDEVGQGQTIALMGSTGRSTGPHVHFEIRMNGRQQNPLGYVQ